MVKYQLTSYPPTARRPSGIWELIKYLGLFLIFFFIFYGILSYPVVLGEIDYFWKTKLKGQKFGSVQQERKIFEPTLPSVKGESSSSTTSLADNHLFIPAINVEVPVVFSVSYKNILSRLDQGVVHYKGSALPGEEGNIFITGHSSNYWWTNNPYNQIFLHLDKLKRNDRIAITYQKKKFVYRISEVMIVKPTDVWVLNPTPKPTLTLMTCTPPGTNLKRLIVRAQESN